MVSLVSGLGGPVGFGENVLPRNDDGSTGLVDITSIFEDGLNFFGVLNTGLFINNNGSVTFNTQRSAFTPDVITANSGNPEITPFFADVDTRTSAGAEEPAGLLPTPTGNSMGSDLVWYDFDTQNDRFVVTWDDVGYFNSNTDKLNAFQLILSDRGSGDFDIEFRYETIDWTTGNASGGSGGLGGTIARAGYTAGTGDPAEFFELPQSGDQEGILALDFVIGNTGQPGRWLFPVRSSEVVRVNLPLDPGERLIGNNWGDPHIVTFDGVGYDFHAAGEFVLAREVGGEIEVQVRQVPLGDSLSVNAAAATRLGGATVMVDATDATPLHIDGVATELTDFSTMTVGNGLIGRAGDVYTIVYPGADGVVNDGDERLEVTVTGNRVDLNMILDATRPGRFEGLMGNADGNPDNDVLYADGTPVARPASFEDLHGRYAEDWRVTTEAASLFTYDGGESLAGFYLPDHPAESATISDLSPSDRAAAEQAAINAGLTPGTFNFNAAVVDYAATGDSSFLESALDAPTIDENAGIGDRLSPSLAKVVAYLFEIALNRDGDIRLEGLNFWIDAREQGVSERELAQYFLDSDEFVQNYGDSTSLNDGAYVDALFQNILNRPPEQAGLDFWVNELAREEFERADLLIAFAESPENIAGSSYIDSLNEVSPGEWAFL